MSWCRKCCEEEVTCIYNGFGYCDKCIQKIIDDSDGYAFDKIIFLRFW
ncbi:MAG TPA: hypothetical protein VMV86_00705 [Methanosarcinales archaeon]|nr:hypothetical protein [Methanosarcinales archaeon]